MSTEIYTIDIDQKSGVVLYGGNDQKVTVYDTADMSTKMVIEGYNESIVYCKYLHNDTFLICALDGHITVTSAYEEIASCFLNEEITTASISDNKIAVGTSLFHVYIFTYDLSHQTVYFGHSSEILQIEVSEDWLYSLSEYALIVHSISSNDVHAKIKLVNASCFSLIPNTEIFCIGTQNYILIYKSNSLISKIEIDGIPECIVFTDNYFVVGGCFDYLLLINTKMNMQTYRLKIETAGINKLVSVQSYTVWFSTLCGYIGSCDIRKDDSLQLYETKVDTVFDFAVSCKVLCVGGLKGFGVQNIDYPE